MPLFGVGVDEDGVFGELVVEVDDVGEVGGGFPTAQGWRDEKSRFGLFVGRVDKRRPVAYRSSGSGIVGGKYQRLRFLAMVQEPGQVVAVHRGQDNADRVIRQRGI